MREVTTGVSTASSSGLSVGQIYDRAHEGVVEITVTSAGRSGGGGQAQGSGFVYDKQGHVVTNHHVVDGASTARVTFSNGETYDATVVGTDPSTDLAVLKVDAPASVLTPLSLGDSSELAVGDGVVAIGSPFGLEQTVTAGIVSALERQMEAPNGFTINDSIQTDAAINHGNSGGPLLDLEGHVVGVNAQISSESGGNDGVGFAIPSNTVETIVSQILSDGDVEHAYLGVGVATIPESATGELDSAAGVALTEVRPGHPGRRGRPAGRHGHDDDRRPPVPDGRRRGHRGRRRGGRDRRGPPARDRRATSPATRSRSPSSATATRARST